MTWDALWVNARLATMVAGKGAYGTLENAALAVSGDRIAWTGTMSELPDQPTRRAALVVDAAGRWVTPGLIDCHTHLVYAGSRAREFELRLEDAASYEEIARAGGGILSTVQRTRAASEAELHDQSASRLRQLLAEGVTTVEIKSGYGLDRETELKQLRVARALAGSHPVTVRTTFLGAHALPPEWADDPDGYVDLICKAALPAAANAGLADAVDAFCETIGFTTGQVERVFKVAAEHGLPVKLHAEQLSDQGGAALAAAYQALSADHLEYVSEAGVAAMASSGTIAVLLPGAFYFLRETRLPPIELFRRHAVPIAIATDSNPGSSPALSLLLMASMACTLFRMTPEEAIAGITRNAAAALGLAETHGTLEADKVADFVLWDIDEPADLAYRIGGNPCASIVRGGHPILPLQS